MNNNYQFQKTAYTITTKDYAMGEADILCYNAKTNQGGTLYGPGIDWDRKWLTIDKIGFLTTKQLELMTQNKTKPIKQNEKLKLEFVNEFAKQFGFIIRSMPKTLPLTR